MTEEIWRPIPGWGDRYEVSNLGRVRSLIRADRPPLILKHSLRKGYESVGLHRPSGVELRTVHRLVAEVFCERRNESDIVVRHLDGNCRNNAASNLAWGTYAENSRDVVRHGRHREASRNHCALGHEYTPENTGWNAGKRRCRICQRRLESEWKSRTRAARRAAGLSALPPGERTHCPSGHPYAGDNVYHDKRGRRVCRACARDRYHRNAAKRRAQQAAA